MNSLIKTLLIFTIVLSSFTACTQQITDNPTHQTVGGPCQGCEALLEYGNRKLNSVDTIPGFDNFGPKLKISGKVYQADGSTPAANVILYFYQTNRDGFYKPAKGAKGWGKTHGQHRTWIKTDKSGSYTLYTFRPAAYPNRREPEHIHLTVKEPQTNPYYLDSYFFASDTLLTESKKRSLSNRGGSGIIELKYDKGLFSAERDIILGLNIPDYPIK
ncbi:MAG: intradiol ring-cleavage dioxygenase [Bacteroidota bacterium]